MPSDRRRDGIGCTEMIMNLRLGRVIDRQVGALISILGACEVLALVDPPLHREIGPLLDTVADVMAIDYDGAVRKKNAINYSNAHRLSAMNPRNDIEISLVAQHTLDTLTGWNRDDLLQWRLRLFGTGPCSIIGLHRHKFDLDTTIVASLYRWRKGVDYKQISLQLGRDGRQWGEAIDMFTLIIYKRYARKLKNSISRYKAELVEFRDAITYRLANPNNESWDPFVCKGPEGTISVGGGGGGSGGWRGINNLNPLARGGGGVEDIVGV